MKCLYLQTQLDTYKLLSEMASRQMQDEAHSVNVDETLSSIQVRCTIRTLYVIVVFRRFFCTDSF